MTAAESDPGGEPRLAALQVILLVAAVLLCRALTVRAVPIYDDAFITYRYAENLAEGRGLVFNPGAAWEPVLGTTTPGYAVLLSGAIALGLHTIPASLGLNFLADAISALLLVRLLRRAALPSTVALLGFAALPHLARVSAGGMEAPVLLACVLGATVASGGRGRAAPWLAGTLTAAACTLRPECVLLVAILGVSHLRPLRRLAAFAAPLVVVGLVYVALLTWVYGTPVPQSVAAKSSFAKPDSLAYAWGRILRQALAPAAPMWFLTPLVLVGWLRVLVRRAPAWPLIAFALAIVAAYLAARPKTWGWYYYVPLTAWVVGLAVGLDALLDASPLRALGQRLRDLAPRAALLLAPLAVVAVGAIASQRPDRVTPAVYRAIETWAAEEGVAERGARILASDIGAIAYYSGARVLDSEGLVWPAALDFPDKLGAIREHRPEYVFLVANHDRLVPFRGDAELAAAYEPVRRFNARDRTDLEPDLDALPRGWVQDYLLYRRR